MEGLRPADADVAEGIAFAYAPGGRIRLVGEWPERAKLDPRLLSTAPGRHVQVTVVFDTIDGPATYRVVGVEDRALELERVAP